MAPRWGMVRNMTVIARYPARLAAASSLAVATPVLAGVVLALLLPDWAWLWLALVLWAGWLPLVALAWRWRRAWRRPWLVALALLIIPLVSLPLGLLALVLGRVLMPLLLMERLEPPAAQVLPAGFPWVEAALLAAIPLALVVM